MAKPKKQKKPAIVAIMDDGSPMVEVFKIEKNEKGELVMDCKALGSMRMDVVVTADGIAEGWPVIKAAMGSVLSFAMQIPGALRRAKKAKKAMEQAQ
ncbi:MAG: hypothetical protein IJO87_08215 [Eggerthellaceae bacterium]|nr:hypothetical protein [Eggerthellaceae bacterium]